MVEGGVGAGGLVEGSTAGVEVKRRRVRAQKMEAAVLVPEVAIWNKVSATLRLASIAEASNSLR